MSLLHAERATLFVLDEAKGTLWSRVAHGSDVIKIPMDKGLVGHTVVTRESINIKDAYNDSRFNRSIDTKTGFRTKAVLVIPIVHEESDKVVGALQVINKSSGGCFDDDDLHFLEAFGKQIGVAVANAITYNVSKDEIAKSSKNLQYLNSQIKSMEERLQEERNEASMKEKRSQLLMEVSQSLMSVNGMDAVFDEVIGNVKRLLHTERATFFLYDKAKKDLYAKLKHSDGHMKEFRIGTESGIVGYAFQSREIVYVSDAYSDARFDRSADVQTGFRTTNLMAAPVFDKDGNTLGVVEAINKQREGGDGYLEFDDYDGKLLVQFATHISIKVLDCTKSEHEVDSHLQFENMVNALREENKTLTSALQRSSNKCNNLESKRKDDDA